MRLRARVSAPGLTLAMLLGGASVAWAQSTVVSLSFDDAYADQRTARTLLAARGMRATFYIVSSFVGRDSGHLTADDLRQFAADGHEIGGHTVTHADLTTLSSASATREVC